MAFGTFTSDGPSTGAILPGRALTFPALNSLARRMGALVLLFVAELVVLSVWLDGASLSVTGLSGFMRTWGSPILRGIVGFAAVFATFAYLKSKAELKAISARLAQTPIRWRLLVTHACAMTAFVALSSVLYGKGLYAGHASEFWANPLAIMWFAAGISAITFAALAFLPFSAWCELLRCTGHLWAFAGMAILLAAVLGKICQRLWQPASVLTFSLTKLVLRPFLSTIIAHPERMVIGTPTFRVQISPECSGLEGVGLIVAFGILWLFVFRRECRFPQSLLLIPLGAVLAYLVNVLRLAALVLIGNAGAPHIAAGGFHSQAGWIAFSALSVGFCLVSQQVTWFTTRPQKARSLALPSENPTAAYLIPFAAILAASLIAAATVGEAKFEWLYPLRLFAAAGALWFYRRRYAELNWRCDWIAPLIGAVVFVLWIALDRGANPAADNQFSATLMASPMITRSTWITLRVLAAIVTVPLAEELAFRGFLLRRLVAADFESVSFRSYTWFALLASSLVFGLLHGGYWIPGTSAGILLAFAAIRRGRIGDAVVAHATANALLAVYVLTYHKWHLW